MQPVYRLILPLLLILSVTVQAQSLTELRTTQEQLTADRQKLIADWLAARIAKIADQKDLREVFDARSEILAQFEGATQIFRSAYTASLNDILRAELNRQNQNH